MGLNISLYTCGIVLPVYRSNLSSCIDKGTLLCIHAGSLLLDKEGTRQQLLCAYAGIVNVILMVIIFYSLSVAIGDSGRSEDG